jgi:DNA-directed RNA polymerase subunit beta'
MIIQDLPVSPCGLRPATKLKEENTIATTQLNNFYRKIILINERVKYYHELNKSHRVLLEEIVHNEERRLQKAVDELHNFCLQGLSGKEGILRNSLGKRVDYSGRSVITPNPHLPLDQVGLPIKMALVLYRPFLLRKICQEKIAFTVKEAEQLLLKNDPVIFPLLNEITRDHPILINRAPTLHRLSIQGLYPRPVCGRTLELHPLLTTPLNADFDGDQIGIYVPLTSESRQEITDYALARQQIVDPKNGLVITTLSKDMILGIHYLTREKKSPSPLFYEE